MTDQAIADVRAELTRGRDKNATVAVTTRDGSRAVGKVEVLTEASVTLGEPRYAGGNRTTRLVLLAEVAVVEVAW